MGKMRTVICLLRNDLRIHDNEVVPTFSGTFQVSRRLFDFPTCAGVAVGSQEWGPHHSSLLL